MKITPTNYTNQNHNNRPAFGATCTISKALSTELESLLTANEMNKFRKTLEKQAEKIKGIKFQNKDVTIITGDGLFSPSKRRKCFFVSSILFNENPGKRAKSGMAEVHVKGIFGLHSGRAIANKFIKAMEKATAGIPLEG